MGFDSQDFGEFLYIYSCMLHLRCKLGISEHSLLPRKIHGVFAEDIYIYVTFSLQLLSQESVLSLM